jgi:hypothetical protein
VPRPSADYVVRQSTDCVTTSSAATSTVRPSTEHAARPSNDRLSLPTRRLGGGSVSGGMELRMTLAQRRSEDEPRGPQEYVFRETRPVPQPISPQSSNRARRGGRLRRLSESIKNIFVRN